MSGSGKTEPFNSSFYTRHTEIVAEKKFDAALPLTECPPTVVSADVDPASVRPFARIVPLNENAKRAFHELVLALNGGKLLRHHEDFIKLEGKTTSLRLGVHDCHRSFSSDTEDEKHTATVPEDEESYFQGHFLLSFHHLTGGLMAPAGHRIGKGSSRFKDDRNVDVLVIPAPKDRLSNSIHRAALDISSVHCLIQVHPDSGVLMLAAGSEHRPVRYLDAHEQDLKVPQKHVLYKDQNTFCIGSLFYNFEYLVEADRLDEYVKDRNAYLQACYPQRSLPSNNISAVPGKGHLLQNIAILHKPISSGAFGVVWSGVDKLTGAPLAVKELCAKTTYDITSITTEIEISRALGTNHTGLLETIQVECTHGGSKPSGCLPETIWMFSPLAQGNFAQQEWTGITLLTRLKLYYDTLKGLQHIHTSGYMHRDIHLKNLLVVSMSPPRAVICDFGKATDSSHDTWYRLGPEYSLAPEVDKEEKTQYDKRIDIYSLGYAWFRTIEPNFPIHGKIDQALHQAMIDRLDVDCHGPGLQASLGRLIMRMVAWAPNERITIEDALQTRCMSQFQDDDFEQRQTEDSLHPNKRAHP